jgi:hypothetical protein
MRQSLRLTQLLRSNCYIDDMPNLLAMSHGMPLKHRPECCAYQLSLSTGHHGTSAELGRWTWRILDTLGEIMQSVETWVGEAMNSPSASRAAVAITTALALVTAVTGCSGHGHGSSAQASGGTISTAGGHVSGLAGSVVITAPKGSVHRAVKLSFAKIRPEALPASAFRLDPHAHPLLAVHVRVTGGTVAGYGATIAMKLPNGLAGRAARAVYLAIYEPRLAAFVHLPTKLNLRDHTVTALAPHFSLISEMIDTIKTVGVGAVKIANLATLGPLDYIPAVRDYVDMLQEHAFDALFAIPPKLKCSPASKDQAVEQDASGGLLLKICAEDIKDKPGYVRLKIRNGYAFPLLLLPGSGIGVGFDDLPANASLLDFVRHIFWMQFNNEEAVGANIAQLTVSPSASLPLQFHGYLDWGAVAMDVAVTIALDILLPECRRSRSLQARELPPRT